ncbi:MAG: SPASM domain-containing protein, partial [Halodesulfovibrio sp.]
IYVSSTYVAETREAIFTMRDEFASQIDEYYVHGTCPVPGVESTELDHGFSLPCPMVFNRVHVTAEGYMNACCFDFENALAVADLTKLSLSEAWESPAFVSVRDRHLAKDARGIMCGNCVAGGGVAYDPVDRELMLRSKRNAKD